MGNFNDTYELYDYEEDIDLAKEEINNIINKIGNYVYVFYGKMDEVLYVGATRDVKMRVRQHLYEKKKDDWNKRIVRIEVYKYASMDDQYAAELSLIRMLKPMYNSVSKSVDIEYPQTHYDQWDWRFDIFKEVLGYRG